MQKLSDYQAAPLSLDKKGKMNKLFSIMITCFVIGSLVFLGPVNALQLSLSGLQTLPYISGETISFTGDIEIQNNEIINVKNVSVVVNGETVCTIDQWGWKLTACEGVNISLAGYSSPYGYGYGYNTFQSNGSGSYAGYGYGYGGYGYGYHQGNGPGHLVYDVTIETPQPYLWFGGNNKVKLVAEIDTQAVESAEENIMLNPLIQGDGNFSMSTDPSIADLTLTGMYNSTDYTLAGNLYSASNSSIHFIGVGTYLPETSTEGDITIRLYDANRNDDVGIFWTGEYDDGNWTMHYIGDPTIEVSGIMHQAPQ